MRRLRRTSKDSSPKRIIRLVPVFILETNNQTNYKYLPKFVQTDNAQYPSGRIMLQSSIKTVIDCHAFSQYSYFAYKLFLRAIKTDCFYSINILSQDYLDFHVEVQMAHHRKSLQILQAPLLVRQK